jgi:histidyl-tRNA synthetase
VDAESIVLLARLLEEMGVSAVRLRLSSLGGPAARAEYRERLQAYLREHQASLSEEVLARIELNPLRAFDSDHEGTRRVMAGAPRLSEHLSDADAEHFAEVCELLGVANVPYELDETLVRGLDYYTRTVFEFTSQALGAQSGVGGGGRYDGLVEALGGPPAPGMGWAAGIERILLAGGPERAGAATAGGSHPPVASPLELFVALEEPAAEASSHQDGSAGPRGGDQRASAGAAGIRAARRAAFALLGEARGAGLTAQMELAGRSLKGQLGHANSLGARYVAIVADGQTTLRDMQGGGQRQIPTDTVVHAVLQGLRTL